MEIFSIGSFGSDFSGNAFYANTLKRHIAGTHLHIEKPHKHDFYACMLFTQGNGTHEIDFKQYPVKPGSLFLMEPGQTHVWELSPEADGLVFFHSREFFPTEHARFLTESGLYHSVSSKNFFDLSQGQDSEIRPLFEKILSEYRERKPGAALSLLSFSSLIYLFLMRTTNSENGDFTNHGPGSYLKLFREFNKWLEDYFRTEKSVQFYADGLHITPKHLNRVNQEMVGKTTSEIIRERVMLEARRMMVYAQGDLKQISYDLGFEDYAHFSKLFKTSSGLSPRDFLRQYSV